MNIPESKTTRNAQKELTLKCLPKSSAEKDNKQRDSNNKSSEIDAKINVDKNQNNPNISKQNIGQSQTTKIPLKRTPMVGNTTSKISSTFVRQPVGSASKLSITLKEGGTKNLHANASKLSFSTNKNSKPISPRGKCLTARSPTTHGISRRSASTISYKSLRSPKGNEEIAHAGAGAAARTLAGDPDNNNLNLSARERVAENNKLRVFESMQKKLQDMQSDFLQKFENLKITSSDKVKYGFKFVTLIKNDECKLLVKDDDLLRLPKKLPLESVADFKNKVKCVMDKYLTDLMEQAKRTQSDTNTNDNDFMSSSKLNEMQNELEKQQVRLIAEVNESINKLCSVSSCGDADTQIIKMQKELQEGRKSIQSLEKKLADLKADNVNETQALEKQRKDTYDQEIAKKDAIISELQKKAKSSEKQYEKLCTTMNQQRTEESNIDNIEKLKLADELKSYKDNIQALNRKLQLAEQHLSTEKKDKQDKIDHILRLETDLESLRKKIDELHIQNKNEEKSTQQLKEKQKEIVRLKNVMSTLENEKNEMQAQLNNSKQECTKLDQKLQSAENQISNLQAELNISELERTNQSGWPVEMKNEMERCRQSENEKQQEVQNLKMELSKAHFNICQLEEQIHRDQQLLEVRSELISSLQCTDNSQRIHLEEMFAQVGEKNNTINEVGLNNELRTKSEEFRNLFTTLSTKQMELSRQDHMIKLLEESNDRSQMLRVKQEEKISRLEEEIAQLKQTIGIYQNNVIGNTGCKNLLFAPMSTNDEYNENLYYYANERRRKRQVDINVKKYEI